METIYDTVCTALLPNADVAVNKELKQLKNQGKKAQPEAFKGAHYALLKNQQDLTDKQATALEQVYRACPPVKMAHRLKECLRRIFESHATKDLAQKRLDKWRQIAGQKKLFPKFCKTLANWADRITNDFHQRITSGIVGGINNKIKLIKRRVFGFRNFEYFRIRVMAVFV